MNFDIYLSIYFINIVITNKPAHNSPNNSSGNSGNNFRSRFIIPYLFPGRKSGWLLFMGKAPVRLTPTPTSKPAKNPYGTLSQGKHSLKILKTDVVRFQNGFKTIQNGFKTYSKRIQNVFKTYSKRIQVGFGKQKTQIFQIKEGSKQSMELDIQMSHSRL